MYSPYVEGSAFPLKRVLVGLRLRPFLSLIFHFCIQKSTRGREGSETRIAPSDTLLTHNYMHSNRSLRLHSPGTAPLCTSLVPRPSSAPGKYKQGGLMAAHSVLPCWIDRQDSLAT